MLQPWSVVSGDTSDAAAKNCQVAFHAIQYGDTRQTTPTRKSVLLDQAQARCVVGKDEAKKSGHPECRCVLNRPVRFEDWRAIILVNLRT